MMIDSSSRLVIKYRSNGAALGAWSDDESKRPAGPVPKRVEDRKGQ